MTALGWIFLALFWGIIIGFTGYCFWVVLAEKHEWGDSETAPTSKDGDGDGDPKAG